MNILYVGDVMGEPGLKVIEQVLPQLKKKEHIDLIIAQAENVTNGRGISVEDFKRLRAAGVDFCTGGNWTTNRKEIYSALNDPVQPIIRPANYPEGTPGLGYKYIQALTGKILVISLLGQIVGRDANRETNNPLQVVDEILKQEKSTKKAGTIVNFHGDYSSEKFIIGYYLDGRVTAVVGDHWHIPTADASVLPKGTAHVTDVGMCGSLDSSLGVKFTSVLPRWRDAKQTHNELETTGRMQFNALLIEVDPNAGLATATKHIRKII
ncbi:MAG TPA: TIGR00282 family metallophosphoesterase [Candidatus Saccharimonadales bacterium]|nr:TIGR00282 family metallophosphoesterase [Candidatus Saccharimonadales bacterium]